MIELNAGVVAIFVTILLALIGGGAAWGTLKERSKVNKAAIEQEVEDRKVAVAQEAESRKAAGLANKEDHQAMFNKLEEVRVAVNSGSKPRKR